jgi:hypothetical protein
MKKAVIHILFDEEFLKDTTVKDEVQAWLYDSGITVVLVEEVE